MKGLSFARFQRSRAMDFGESAKKWVAEALFFCQVDDTPLLPLFLDRFPPNFLRTHVQVMARETWFHIPEKFPLRSQISRKTVFLGYPVCAQPIRLTGNVLRRLDCFHPLVNIHRFILTFAEGCIAFQLSTSERFPLPQYQQRRNVDAYISFKQTRQEMAGTPSDRRLHVF